LPRGGGAAAGCAGKGGQIGVSSRPGGRAFGRKDIAMRWLGRGIGGVLAACRRAVVLLPVLVAATAAAAGDGRFALVVGNSAYRAMPGLATPAEDTRRIADALRRTGFEVTLLTDLSGGLFWPVLDAFAAQARGADAVVFYYAGHAFQSEGRNFLVPVDAAPRADRPAEGTWPLTEVLARLAGAGTTTLVFLDACRTNPFGGAAGGADGLAAVDGGAGTFIAFATRPGQVSFDRGSGAVSPFAAALLAHLETPGIGVSDMMIRVRRDVEAATVGRQVPWDQSSLREPFAFVPAAAPGGGEVVVAGAAPTATPAATRAAPPPPLVPAPVPAPEPPVFTGFEISSEVTVVTEVGVAPPPAPGAGPAAPPPAPEAAPVPPPTAAGAPPALPPAVAAAAAPPPPPLPALGPAPVLAAAAAARTALAPVAAAAVPAALPVAPAPALPAPASARLAALAPAAAGGASQPAARTAPVSEPRPVLVGAAPGSPPPEPVPDDLPRAVQEELRRTGCYNLPVDGDWGGGSRNALARFHEVTGTDPGPLDPTEAVWRQLRAAPDGICPPPPKPQTAAAPKAPAKKTAKPSQETAAKAKPKAEAKPKAAAKPAEKKGVKCTFVVVAIVCK
jgi:hypothetical protein